MAQWMYDRLLKFVLLILASSSVLPFPNANQDLWKGVWEGENELLWVRCESEWSREEMPYVDRLGWEEATGGRHSRDPHFSCLRGSTNETKFLAKVRDSVSFCFTQSDSSGISILNSYELLFPLYCKGSGLCNQIKMWVLGLQVSIIFVLPNGFHVGEAMNMFHPCAQRSQKQRCGLRQRNFPRLWFQ